MKDPNAMTVEEKWSPIPGYETTHQVSSIGRVRRISGERNYKPGLLKGNTDRRGYRRYLVTHNGQRMYLPAARAVAIAFIGRPPTPKHTVNHINGNKTDNRVQNLEWLTSEDNSRHAHRTGLCMAGENHPKSKLTWKQVGDIRRQSAGGASSRALSLAFGVSKTAIQKIVDGKNWRVRDNSCLRVAVERLARQGEGGGDA